jgi:two-component system, sensor histidine kinase and response regulator
MLNEHVELALQEAGVHLFEIPISHGVNSRQLEGLDVAPEDQERLLCEIGAFTREAMPRLVVEYRAADNGDGPVRWRRARGSLVRDEHGQATHLVGSTQDITELKEIQQEVARRAAAEAQRALDQQQLVESAEEEARRAVEVLKLATSLSGITVFGFDLSGGDMASAKPLFVNSPESLGYGPEEKGTDLASSVDLIIHPEDRPRLLGEVQAYLEGGSERFEVEARVRRKDGGIEWQIARGVAIRDADGRPLRLYGTAVYVTRLKQVEAELRAMNEKFDLAMEHFDFRLTEIDLSNAASSSSAVSNESLNRRGVRSMSLAAYVDYLNRVTMPEDLPRALELFHGVLRGGAREGAMEARVQSPSGDGYRWRLGRFKVYCDESGVPTRCVSFSYDIQQLKTAEEEARKAAQLLRVATELSGVAIWGYDIGDASDLSTAKSVFAVDRTFEELGYDSGELPPDIAGRMERALQPEDRPRFSAAVQDCLAGRSQQFDIEYGLAGKDGRVRWKLSRGIAAREASGRSLRFMGTSVDITQLKQTQEELQRVKDRLERALRASNTATWDLETPDGLLTSGIPVFHNAWEQCGYDAPSDPQLAAQVLVALLPPGDAEPFIAKVQAFFDGSGREWEIEERVLHKDGTERWHLKRGTVERNADGRVTRFSGTTTDIIDRKQIEGELERTKDRLELALWGSKACTWDFVVPDGQIANAISVYTNAWELLGHEMPSNPQPASEVLSALLSSEDLQPFTNLVQVVFDGTGQDWEVEQRVKYEDGTARWLLGRGVVMRNESGRVTRFIGTAIDITDRKLIERALADSEERFRRTFENAAVGMILTDLEGKFLEYNRRFCEFLGYASEDLSGRCVFEFMDPDEAALHLANQQCVVRGEAPSFSRDTRYFRKDDAVVWGNLTLSVIQRHADGTPVHVMGILQDITERKVLEAEVRQGKETLELAMRGSDISVAVIDFADGDLNNSRSTVFNFWELQGIDPATAPADYGASSRLSIHPDDYDAVLADFRAAAEARRPRWDIEHRFFHADGSVRWRLSRGTVLYDTVGNVSRFLATAIDITKLKQIESELLRARQAAEAANRAKDEFLANVSHEIRTPMNAILGITELALDSAPNNHQRQLLSTVRSAAKNLLGIINDLLDFSKIEAGKLTLDRAPFSLRAAVGDTLRALAVRAHRKGLELLCRVHPEVPDALDGDAGRLRQVLMNLVGNAIKFTHRGEVEVEVGIAPSCGASHHTQDVQLVFTVRDTGVGIAAETQAVIFQAFEQGDSSTTRNYGGTGLGLTISAQLAALMNGSITVESAPGCGSKFRFTASFVRSLRSNGMTTSPEQPADPPVPALNILVAEDNELNIALLEELLPRRGHHAQFARDGRAALDLALAPEEACDLMLLDLHMPGLDGLQVARAIREHEQGTSRHLPIIALTARSSAHDRERCIAAGMDEFLSKPIEAAALWAAVERLCGRWSVDSLKS